MIKANELRIGNYVQRMEHKDLRRVVELTGNGTISHLHIGIDDKEVGLWDDDAVEPIPLTEDWLLKFGFTSIDNTNIYVKSMHKICAEKLKSLAVYLDEKDYTIAIVDYYTGVEKTDLLHLNYKHVHSLQNLYFALTGEELTVKE